MTRGSTTSSSASRAPRRGEVGTVARVDHMPAQDLIAVKVDGRDDEVLVPFVKAIVTAVDITAGTVTVDPPIGLFEELPDDEPDEPAAPSDDAPAETDPAE